MATTISAPFGTLPHYLQQRVLAGVPFHDHHVTAAACKAFRAIIRGPGFLALRQRHGFAERVVVVVGNTHLAQGVRLVAVKPGQMTKEESLLSGVRPETRAPGCSFEEKRLAKLLEVKVAAQGRFLETRTFERVRISNRGMTTDGGARMFVSTLRYESIPEQILSFNVSSRKWKRVATLPRSQLMHCCEWHNGILYVAGGLGSSTGSANGFGDYEFLGNRLGNFFAFSEATGLWEALPPMPHSCELAASGVIGNQLYIAGGRTEQGMFSARPLSTLQIYDIATRTWRLGPELPPPGPRSIGCVGAFGFVMDGKLVLVKHGNLLTYDPQSESETWAESASYPSEGRYPPRMHHACVHNGRIIVFMENGSAFARAADGSWATYEGAAAVGPPVFGLLAPQHYASESVLLG